MHDLKGKVLIITGAGSGIGRETALMAGRAGARLALADIDRDKGRNTAAEVEASGGIALFLPLDISDEASVEAMVAKTVSGYGRIDGAFNNAAVARAGFALHELTAAHFRRAMDVNVTGTFFCMKHQIAAMLETGGGSIVNTSSGASVVAYPGASEYIASKHAIIGLTKAAAVEYGKQAIRVNALLPGAVQTPMLKMADREDFRTALFARQPLGRIGQPSEIAAAALWLLGDQSAFVTGASVPVDGGFTIA